MTTQAYLGVVVACEREAAVVRRYMQRPQRQITAVGMLWRGNLCGHAAVLLRCGMGPNRATQAMVWFVRAYHLWGVLSVGFAGGLQAAVATGHAIVAEHLLEGSVTLDSTLPMLTESIKPDTRWTHMAATAAAQAALIMHRGVLVSVPEILSPPAKEYLGRHSAALAVDMETHSIGRVAAACHLPFTALRTIFDACDDVLPFHTDRFTTADGRLQPLRLLSYMRDQPYMLRQLPSLWRKTRVAETHLARWLYHFLTLLRCEE
jgi:adenosylhomocysteine nucleosidase